MADFDNKKVAPISEAIGSHVAQTGRWGGLNTATSAFVYAFTSMQGQYEIVNNTSLVTSSALRQPNYPVWNVPTEVVVDLDAQVTIEVVNLSSNFNASSTAGRWQHTTSTPFGGFEVTGNLYTSAYGEKFYPAVSSTSAGVWIQPNGQMMRTGTYNTGTQQYRIMQQPGPWPTGSGANTSSTIPGEMDSIFTDLGSILNAQGANGLQSLTNNWNSTPAPPAD